MKGRGGGAYIQHKWPTAFGIGAKDIHWGGYDKQPRHSRGL